MMRTQQTRLAATVVHTVCDKSADKVAFAATVMLYKSSLPSSFYLYY